MTNCIDVFRFINTIRGMSVHEEQQKQIISTKRHKKKNRWFPSIPLINNVIDFWRKDNKQKVDLFTELPSRNFPTKSNAEHRTFTKEKRNPMVTPKKKTKEI